MIEKADNDRQAIEDDIQLRLQKLREIKKLGYNPYPERFDKTHLVSQVLNSAKDISLGQAEDIHTDDPSFRLAGRLMTIRRHGKLVFAHLQDASGRLQIAFTAERLGEQFALLDLLDLGDFVGVEGKLFKTHKGEITLMADELMFLGKALRQLPEKFHGLKDQEIRYRQRYLDLLVNPDTRKRFKIRKKVIKFLREFLEGHGFEEVETPILNATASGALAKPFITHHNALDIDLYLRIAPETYLKRLIVGGYERVFEFARCFRNEGIDPSHLQEFTMLEFYAAYWNWQDNMKFTEELVSSLVKEIFGTLEIEIFGQKISFAPPYEVVTMRELIKRDSGIDIEEFNEADKLRAEIGKRGIEIEELEKLGYGNLVDALYKKVSRQKIINPTFVIAHPIELSPLARANDDNPKQADRFQLVVNGWEVVNAYSELVDPQEQRRRLQEQAKLKSQGDEEAMMMDEDYILAMEYGMPPISGWGMGIDRIVALLTSQENLKDVVFFPLMKPKVKEEEKKDEILEIEEAKEAGITREQAIELLKKYIPEEDNLFKHSLAVEAVMRALAKKFNRSQDVWGIAGLLHDIDYPLTKNHPEKHGLIAEEILQQEGIHPEIVYAVKAHNFLHELSLPTLLAKALYSVEELTGLITACALVQPDKKIKSVSVESIKKKFKQKSFAAGVNRAIVKKAEELLGIELDEIFAISLSAMQEVANDLGL